MLLPPNVLALDPTPFSVAVAGDLIFLDGLIRDLRRMLEGVGAHVEASRLVAAHPELEALAQAARERTGGRRWTVGEMNDALGAEDPNPEAVEAAAPLFKMLLTSAAEIAKREAAVFPPLVWSSVVVTALAHWEVVLRRYAEYLSGRLVCARLAGDPSGKALTDGFRRLVQREAGLAFDFGASASWQAMQEHQAVRNVLVHWGGLVAGSHAGVVDRVLERAGSGLERRGPGVACTEVYAAGVIRTATQFLNDFEEALRPQLESRLRPVL